VRIDQVGSLRAFAIAEFIEHGAPAEAAFDREHAPVELVDRDYLGKCEGRFATSELIDESLTANDILRTTARVEHADDAVAVERVHPRLAAVAEHRVGRNADMLQHRDQPGVVGEVHRHTRHPIVVLRL
jgi:hypothetical protein